MANTNAPLSEVAICIMAASALDDKTLTSLDDNTVIGRFMASNYGRVRDQTLRSHVWNCAKTRKLLAPVPLTSDDFGWDYKYTLPEDCLRLLPLRNKGQWSGGRIPHELEGRDIRTNYGPVLPVIYIQAQPNAALLDPLLAAVIAGKLAVLGSHKITGKASYTDKALTLFKMAWDEAVHTNALELGTPEHVENDAFVSSSSQGQLDFLSVRGVGL